MQKLFVKTNQIENNRIDITGENFKHISKVLRMKIGDKLQICDEETSHNYVCKIVNINTDMLTAEIIEEIIQKNESNAHITLFQGLPKADKMELIIQKTTEIGINKIVPVDMERCVVKLDEKEANKKIQRWKKIAISAAEQSKRDIIPIIENKIKLKDILENINNYDSFIVAYEEETENTLKVELRKIPKKEKYDIGILIGPEGGISDKEIQLLKTKGANIVTLGKRILRCETAPITMVSNIIYELED